MRSHEKALALLTVLLTRFNARNTKPEGSFRRRTHKLREVSFFCRELSEPGLGCVKSDCAYGQTVNAHCPCAIVAEARTADRACGTCGIFGHLTTISVLKSC